MAGEIPASPFVNLSAMIKKRILLLLSSWGLLFSVFAAAQSPTTTYPYLYDRFVDGKVVLDNGETEARSLNVHLRADALHYVDNNVIKQAFLNNVKAVEIGPDVFLPVNGRMLRLAAKNDRGCVAEQIAGDFEAARAGEGAYGLSSTTAATMKLTSIQTDSQINQNYMNILNEKDHGVPLRTVSTYYIFTQKIKLKAAEKDIREALPADKVDAWKAFLKTNKIKWKNPQSVLAVVDFLSNY